MNRFEELRSKLAEKMGKQKKEQTPLVPDSSIPNTDAFEEQVNQGQYIYDEVRREALEPHLNQLGLTIPEDPNDPNYNDFVARVKELDRGLAVDVASMRTIRMSEAQSPIFSDAKKNSDRFNALREFIDDKLYEYNSRGERVLNKKLLIGGVLVAGAMAFPLMNLKPPKADTVTNKQQGTVVRNTDGTTTTTFGDGTVVNTLADGTEITRKPNGEVDTKTPDGVITTSYQDGRKLVTQPDGSSVETLPDGSTTRRDANGNVINTPPTTANLNSPLNPSVNQNPEGNPNARTPADPITGLTGGTGEPTTVSNPDPNASAVDPITGMPSGSTANNTPTSSGNPTTGTTSGTTTPSSGYSTVDPITGTSTVQGSTPTTAPVPSGTSGSGYSDPTSANYAATTPSTTGNNVTLTDPTLTVPAGTASVPSTTVNTQVSPPATQTPTESNKTQNEGITVPVGASTPRPQARVTIMRVGTENSATGDNGASGSTQPNQGNSSTSGTGTNTGGITVYKAPPAPSTTIIRTGSTVSGNPSGSGQASGTSILYGRTQTQSAPTVADGTAKTSVITQGQNAASTTPSNTPTATGMPTAAGLIPAGTPTNGTPIANSDIYNTVFGQNTAGQASTQGAASSTQTPAVPSPYRLGQRMQATLETGVFVAQTSPTSLPVYARTQDGTLWRGQISLDATKRVSIIFDRAILRDGTEITVEAAAYNMDGTPGVKARYRDIAPTLANDLVRSALSGVHDYVEAKIQATTTTQNANGSTTTQRQAPTIYESVAASSARVFTLPPTQNTFVTVAEIPVGNTIAIVYGPTTTQNNQR